MLDERQAPDPRFFNGRLLHVEFEGDGQHQRDFGRSYGLSNRLTHGAPLRGCQRGSRQTAEQPMPRPFEWAWDVDVAARAVAAAWLRFAVIDFIVILT